MTSTTNPTAMSPTDLMALANLLRSSGNPALASAYQADPAGTMQKIGALDAAPNQMKLGQQLYGNGQSQLGAAQSQLAGKTPSVNGVAGRTSPLAALGAGLQGGAGLQQMLQGRGQQQSAAGQQVQGQQFAQMLAIANALRGGAGGQQGTQQGAQSGSQGDLDPGDGVEADAENELYGGFGG